MMCRSPEVTKPSSKTETRQWTVDPQDGRPRGFAFIWRRFEIPVLPTTTNAATPSYGDVAYCRALGDIYLRYVGRDEWPKSASAGCCRTPPTIADGHFLRTKRSKTPSGSAECVHADTPLRRYAVTLPSRPVKAPRASLKAQLRDVKGRAGLGRGAGGANSWLWRSGVAKLR